MKWRPPTGGLGNPSPEVLDTGLLPGVLGEQLFFEPGEADALFGLVFILLQLKKVE